MEVTCLILSRECERGRAAGRRTGSIGCSDEGTQRARIVPLLCDDRGRSRRDRRGPVVVFT